MKDKKEFFGADFDLILSFYPVGKVSNESIQLLIDFKKEYGVELYHSIMGSFRKQGAEEKTLREVYEEYLDRWSYLRELIVDSEELRSLFKYCYGKHHHNMKNKK